MIVTFRDDWLRAFFVDDIRSRNIPSDLESRLFRKLQMIDDATTDRDLRVPLSNHFEKLRGKLADFHSIRVSKQWRLISNGMVAEAKRQASISTTTAIREVSHADDETEAGKRRRNPRSGIHEADGIDSGRVG
jgi:proteic killer suppression protein